MTSASNAPSQTNAPEDHGLDAESLSAIRSILTEDDTPKPRKRTVRSAPAAQELAPQRDVAPLRRKADDLPPLVSPQVEEDLSEVPAKRGFSLRRKRKGAAAKKSAPVRVQKAAKETRAPRAGAATDEAGIIDRIKGYRPKPAHIALGAFALLVLMRPWLVFGVAFLLAIILAGVFLIVGYDGFWKGVMKAGRWYAKRRPERAAVLNTRLDRFAMRWDAILDRFPEGSVDGLYLPDFGELAMAEQRHDEAVERRLAGLSS